MPKGFYTRLPLIQYKSVIYTAAVFHEKKKPVCCIYTAAVPIDIMCRFVRCETQVGFCLEVEFYSTARGATYSAFVFIFISFSKTNLMAFNLMLLHVYVYQSTMWKLFMASGNIWKSCLKYDWYQESCIPQLSM